MCKCTVTQHQHAPCCRSRWRVKARARERLLSGAQIARPVYNLCAYLSFNRAADACQTLFAQRPFDLLIIHPRAGAGQLARPPPVAWEGGGRYASLNAAWAPLCTRIGLCMREAGSSSILEDEDEDEEETGSDAGMHAAE